MTRNYVWSGRASSEGGPILVADADAYGHWSGAKATWSNDGPYRVHYYGPLVERLPAKLQPSGADEWHQYAVCSGIEAARAYVAELRAEAQRLEPKLAAREQSAMSTDEIAAKARAASTSESAMNDWLTSWRDHMEQGVDLLLGDERLLHVDASPETDYAKACEALTGDVAFVKVGQASGVVWETAGPGTADIGREKDGFVLLIAGEGSGDEEDEDEGDDDDGDEDDGDEDDGDEDDGDEDEGDDDEGDDDEGDDDEGDDDDDDDEESERIGRAAREHVANVSPDDEEDAGTIRFSAGCLAVVWAPVTPEDIVGQGSTADDVTRALRAASKKSPPAQLRAHGSPVGSVVLLPPGEYRVRSGEYEGGAYSCRWLRISAI
ncbi:MAG TPA: hypothetical protein VGK73_13340 [Polyangiaceae bacterium]